MYSYINLISPVHFELKKIGGKILYYMYYSKVIFLGIFFVLFE